MRAPFQSEIIRELLRAAPLPNDVCDGLHESNDTHTDTGVSIPPYQGIAVQAPRKRKKSGTLPVTPANKDGVPLEPSTPGQRIKWAMRRKELDPTAKALANVIPGLRQNSARSWLNDNRHPSLEQCLKIAKALGVNAYWLKRATGDPLDTTGSVADEEPGPLVQFDSPPSSHRKFIPVYSAGLAGPDGEIQLVAERSHRVLSPLSLEHIQDAYGVKVSGDSMENRLRHGDTVFVDPYDPIARGDDVVVQFYGEHDQGTVFGLVKRFVSFTSKELILEQLNPKKELRYAAERVKAVHRIVDVRFR